MSDAARWDKRFADVTEPGAPSWILQHHRYLLPAAGTALDLACGVAGNALLLAAQGLQTSAWDISATAVALQAGWAQQRQLPLQTRQRDCEAQPPEPNSFDVICISHFLYRPASTAIVAALKPSGLLFYQTFCADKLDSVGPSRDEHLLQSGELLQLFGALEPRIYREDRRAGDLDQGERNRAFLIAQKSA